MSNQVFEENYALASDNNERTTLLASLIAGSPDYYYYNSLHLLNVDPQLKDKANKTKFQQILKDWTNDHGAYDDGLHQRIKNRAHLLGFSSETSEEVFESIKRQLNLTFSYYPSSSASSAVADSSAAPLYPSKLDEKLIDRATLIKRAIADYPYQLRFPRSAIPYVVNNHTLSPEQLKQALQQCTYPVFDKTVDLLVQAGFTYNQTSLFANLTLAQMDKWASSKPELVDQRFVSTYLNKLQPSKDDVDWTSVPEHYEAYLKAAYAYVTKLPASLNSFKHAVLYHYLTFQVSQNVYDNDKFTKYCQLPRDTHYYNNKPGAKIVDPINFNTQISDAFTPVSVPDDEKLLRAFFTKIFQTENSFDSFTKFFTASYLQPIFAEIKLLTNTGDMEKWYQMVDSHTRVQELKDRVDIDFLPQNPEYFSPDQAVEIKCAIKNVQHLLVKVFEINTLNYYKTEQRQIQSDINLDGLVANQEFTYKYTEAPIQSVVRSFSFPSLKGKRGIFVIEFIGNGKSSRALIRKGELHYISATSQDGQVIRVIDEDSVKIVKSSVYVDGNLYKSEESGDIILPFSVNQSNKPIILVTEDFATLKDFTHNSEKYTLVGGIFLENSTFLQGERAPIVVRARLYLNNTQISLTNLEESTLTITTTDNSAQSIVTAKEVKPFALNDKEESTYSFKVPENVSNVTVRFDAKVRQLKGKGDTIDVSFEKSLPINSINESSDFVNCYLRYSADGFKVYALGKGGECYANKQLSLTLKHSMINDAIYVTLQTDKDGIIHLGKLVDIDNITINSEQYYSFDINSNRAKHNYPVIIHARAGEQISIPYNGPEKSITRSAFNLFEIRYNVTNDHFDKIQFDKEKQDIIFKLPPGQYLFCMSQPEMNITIQVCDGDVKEGFIVGSSRILSYHPSLIHGLNISAVADKKNLEITLRNPTATTRVHVLSSYFVPPQELNNSLSVGNTPVLSQEYTKTKSLYFSGRSLGDEITYVLNRKLAKNTLPGNSLKKPSLLMQPWSIAKTTQQKETLSKGDEYAKRSAKSHHAANACPISRNQHSVSNYSCFLEFLKTPTAVLLNLVPDAKGVVTVPLSALTPSGQFVTITAVDIDNVVTREIVLDHTEATLKDTKLVRSLDAQAHFTEKKLITTVPVGQEFTISNADSAKFTTYDTLAKVLSLIKTISPSSNLQDFSFVAEWGTLTAEQKNEKLSKFYCHELAFFIYKKDRTYFDAVVKPFVASKMHKTFFDHYFTGNHDRLEKYITSATKFEELNVLERILLAEVFPEQAQNIQASIVDRVQFSPLSPVRYDTLFKIALSLDTDKGASDSEPMEPMELEMDGEGGGGAMDMDMMVDERRQRERAPEMKMKKNLAFAPSPAPGGFSFAGPMGAAPPPPAQAMASMAPMSMMRMAADTPMGYGELSQQVVGGAQRHAKKKVIYEEIEKTEEWAETHYYKNQFPHSDLVPCNEFWRDYVLHVVAGLNNNNVAPFLSKYIALTSSSFTSAMATLAVLDLPFETKDKEPRNIDGRVTYKPTSNIIVFHEELISANLERDTNVLISQHFFDPNNRYSYDNNEQNEIYLHEEFLCSKVYGALIVVANLSSKRKKLDILLQIPKGSVPIGPHPFYTRGESVELSPYSTHRIEYQFYFPSAGSYQHFPTHVSEKDKIIAAVVPFTFKVVTTPTIVNQLSWEYIASNGTQQAILEFLQRENLNRVELYHMYHKLTDHEFWKKVIEILKSKKVFDSQAWSFAVYHKDAHYCQDYLSSVFGQYDVGKVIQSQLLTSSPIERNDFSYLEYYPLVNSRTHQLGKRKILNDKLSEQYKKFCELMTYTTNPSDSDLLSLVYYLLSQDRFDEGFKTMKRVGVSDESQSITSPDLPSQPMPAPAPASTTSTSSGAEDTNEKKRKADKEEKLKEKEDKRKEKEREKLEKKKEKEVKRKEKEERKKKEEEDKKLKKLAKKSKTEDTSASPVTSGIGAAPPAHDDDTECSDMCVDVSDFNEPSNLPELQVQFDYLISYMDFFNANPTKAKELSEKYKNYPVQRWNALFKDIYNKIQQVTNSDTVEVDDNENDRDRRHAKLLATEPSFDVSLEPNRTIAINYTNLTDVTINYYIMDIELLFSSNPFVQQELGQFLYISPNKKESFPLKELSGTHIVKIPEEFKNSNIMVDCQSHGIHHNLTIYSNNLAVQITEKAGQLRVIEKQTKKPISKAYIKVYEKSNSGNVQFWKDGYSDIAGYFDYASVSTGNINDVSKLSILVLHNQFGALIKEAKPPAM
ncbi:hypothetical protein SAMD00019534_091780 [Acytostelium subglobosum LB1]|uniref:hypothetical protein n=1 Tax=Acytostelium subglobosum LB1 TaxID=1410327 RepID=UPI000644BF7A|nr:hypothetical protein SAMD00019534_091780 [Acytostelium subglobosum LB1]GAM26003.1 hypothetical protein SAMD00019534_091780 [Acytostelium subglobosum LB1]|eukprot:XP_012751046.1 hypothetical protein SAMD00019534_091780 [Acytostelium subglobosum LB1]